jgi:hypothetical protein
MRRSTKAANYRTALRLETLESRNVLSATAACMASLVSAAVQQVAPEPTSFVVVTGACGAVETPGAVLQLANSNDFPEVVTCEPQPEPSAVVAADLTVGPTLNSSNIVAEVPTSDVAMPQGTLPDGVLRPRERPFPPLVLIASVDTVEAPNANSTVETPITEFECNVVITLNRPEQPVDTNVAPTVLSSPEANGETNGVCEGPVPPATSQSSTPVNTAVVNSEPVVTPPRGRVQYRPTIEVPPPIVSPPIAREVVFATQAFQPVGARPRRRA